MQAASDIEENGLVCALDPDVETIDREIAPLLPVGNERVAPVRRNKSENGIAVVGLLVRKIKPGVDLPQHSTREDAEHNMGRLILAVRPRYRTRLDGVETKDPVLVGRRTAKAHE